MPRPTKYTAKLARAICDRLAEGETLTAICRDPTMPTTRTVRRWREDLDNRVGDLSFDDAYARAREDQAHRWADDIVDESQVDLTGEKPDSARVAAARLRVDAKRWVVSRVLPHVYGDRPPAERQGPARLVVQLVHYDAEGNRYVEREITQPAPASQLEEPARQLSGPPRGPEEPDA